MIVRDVSVGRWAVGTALLLATLLAVQVSAAAAASPEIYALPHVVAQVPTPTPFRFVTPTPLAPGPVTTTPTSTVPRAGGIPLELAVPALVSGLAAIGGGTFLFRRRRTR